MTHEILAVSKDTDLEHIEIDAVYAFEGLFSEEQPEQLLTTSTERDSKSENHFSYEMQLAGNDNAIESRHDQSVNRTAKSLCISDENLSYKSGLQSSNDSNKYVSRIDEFIGQLGKRGTSNSKSASENERPSKKRKKAIDKSVGFTYEFTAGTKPPKPDNDDHYRLVRINSTGALSQVLRTMQALVEPAIVLLRKSGVIGMKEDFATLEEDVLRYHLRTVKKEIQEKGISIDSHCIDVTSAVLYCFLVCKSKLTALSVASASGYLYEFYTKKQEQLKGVAAMTGNREYDFLATVLPNAISILQNLQDSFQHPKILETLKILRERFTKDLRRGTVPSKVLLIIRNACGLLIEELAKAIDELNAVEFSNSLKTVVLPVANDQYYSTKVLSQAIAEGCNVTMVSTEYSQSTADWSEYNLFLEYESYPNSPWMDISAKHRICHIAMDIEQAGFQDLEDMNNLCAVTRNEISIIASRKITMHPYLVQLLETRHNITIISDTQECTWDNPSRNTDIFESHFSDNPDVIISLTTCMIVEDCSILCEANVRRNMERAIDRAWKMQAKFTKCYLVICHLSPGQFRYSSGGPFLDNMEKLTDAVSQSTGHMEYKISVLYVNDGEEFAKLISRMLARLASEKSISGLKANEFGRDERFIAQFPTINLLVAQKLLSHFKFNDVANRSLSELTQCVPEVPVCFLEDFQKSIRSQNIVSKESLGLWS